jgi:hypothetical protein
MATFVRKNAITFTAVFTAADGSGTQPSTATLRIFYTNTSGTQSYDNIDMTYNAVNDAYPLGNWTGVWDSNVAGRGNVEWVVYGAGSIEAANQGQFQVLANAANNV